MRCSVLIIATVLALGSSPAPPRNFVAGQVLVRFAPGTEASAAAIRASQTVPLELQSLAPIARDLQQRTGIPLTVTNLTGGNWVVLSIEADELNAHVVDRLRRREYIAGIRVSPEKPEQFIGFSPPKKIEATLNPDSPESQSVERHFEGGESALPPSVISRMERDCGTPLQGERRKQRVVLLQVDLRALTLTLEQRLRALPNIDATQLNKVVKRF